MSSDTPRIGFLGAGKMATALARGWLSAGLAASDQAIASEAARKKTEAVRKEGPVLDQQIDIPPPPRAFGYQHDACKRVQGL